MAASSTGVLEVALVSARALKNTEVFGKMDPYVVIQYKNEEKRSSPSCISKPRSNTVLSWMKMKCCYPCLRGQGQNPVWNETFKFQVEYKSGGDEQDKLILKLMDHDTFTNDDYLGHATIYLKELFEQGVESGKAELRTQKYRVVSENQTYHGEIQVGVTFTLNNGGAVSQHQNGNKNGGLKNDSHQF